MLRLVQASYRSKRVLLLPKSFLKRMNFITLRGARGNLLFFFLPNTSVNLLISFSALKNRVRGNPGWEISVNLKDMVWFSVLMNIVRGNLEF